MTEPRRIKVPGWFKYRDLPATADPAAEDAAVYRAADSIRFFAVIDPANAGRMTYWRRTRGTLRPWPPKASYLPLPRIPAWLRGPARQDYVRIWYEEHGQRWYDAVHEAVNTDPVGCAAAFAAWQVRCMCCRKPLTDPASKTYGVGPDCRRDMPPSVLADLAEAVRRAHAEATGVAP